MPASIGRKVRDTMIGAGGVGATVAGMAAVNDVFRKYLVDAMVNGQLPFAVKLPDFHIEHLNRLIGDTLSVPIGAQPPLMVFFVSGVVLFLFMFRL